MSDPGPGRTRRLVLAALAVLAIGFGAGAGYLLWQTISARAAATAATESVAAAREATEAILSYRAATVEADLNLARDRLTGSFLDSFTALTKDVVIPGAKQKQITTEAKVPAAASVSATAKHAVVLVFVDQTVTEGAAEKPTPTTTTSSVRVTLDKVGGRWLVSGFDPI